jgi:hypothetical protein
MIFPFMTPTTAVYCSTFQVAGSTFWLLLSGGLERFKSKHGERTEEEIVVLQNIISDSEPLETVCPDF